MPLGPATAGSHRRVLSCMAYVLFHQSPQRPKGAMAQQPFCSMLMEILLFPDLAQLLHSPGTWTQTHTHASSYMDVAYYGNKKFILRGHHIYLLK